MKSGVEILVHRALWAPAVELLIVEHGVPGGQSCACSLALRPPVVEGASQGPTCVLDQDRAQQLMDGLWVAGLRPSEGTGSAGALAATQAHLKDLQRLVFDIFAKGGGR